MRFKFKWIGHGLAVHCQAKQPNINIIINTEYLILIVNVFIAVIALTNGNARKDLRHLHHLQRIRRKSDTSDSDTSMGRTAQDSGRLQRTHPSPVCASLTHQCHIISL